MCHLPPGVNGLLVALLLFVGFGLLTYLTRGPGPFNLDPEGISGAFEPFLTKYLGVAEFIVGLAAGSIVLLMGSSVLHGQNGGMPWYFASPLLLLGSCVVYGTAFMVWLIFHYEDYRHGATHTRTAYSLSLTLGFSAFSCFVVGFGWLVFMVTRLQGDGAVSDPKSYFARVVSPENLPNIGLFFAGVGGIIIAFFTLGAMRDASKKQLRAYVVQEMGSIVNVADPIPAAGLVPTEARITHPLWGPVARVQIKNTGQTPALQVEHWGNICLREYPLISGLPALPVGKPSRSILGAGIVSTKSLTYGPPLTSQQIADLRAGTVAIYIYGEIKYKDIFRKSHFTRYRLMHHAIGGVIGISTDLTFTEEGNEAD
jgi:hypothetical protein